MKNTSSFTPEEQRKLFKEHQGLIRHRIKAWSKSNIDPIELESAAMYGFTVALNYFKEGHGTKFSSFASHCMNCAIRDAVEKYNNYDGNVAHNAQAYSVNRSPSSVDPDAICGKFAISSTSHSDDSEYFVDATRILNTIENDTDRELVVEHYIKGTPRYEIGNNINTSRTTVANRLNRIIAKIRHKLNINVKDED